MALIAMSPWLTCYQLRTMRRFSRITAPATSPQTKRIQRSVRPTRIRHQLPHRLSRTEMIATDLRLNPPHNAMLVAAILGTDLYSFVQASFAIVSGGGRFLPNWHIEAICHELSHVWRGETRRLIITVPPASLYLGPRSRSPDHLCQLFRRACAQARQRLSRPDALQSLQGRIPYHQDQSCKGHRDRSHDDSARFAACDLGRWHLDRSWR